MPGIPHPQLSFFLDRGLGSKIIPQMLRDAGWLLVTMDERYGSAVSQSVADTDWIASATEYGDVILCKDLAIARNPVEADVVERTSARIFGLANARLSGPQAAHILLGQQAAIFAMALRASGPYVVAVSDHGLKRRRLSTSP
jgi:hypothetical protein